MTLYTIPNRSVEDIDPHKQPQQNPPVYSPLPENASIHQDQEQEKQTSGKPTVGERFHKMSSKAGWPVNKAANVVGSEGFWPASLDKECNKAARILHSFTSLEPSMSPKANGPMHPTGITRKSAVKIPPSVLETCAGLAIFNVLRLGGGHSSLGGGSGVIVSRRADGTWSPPSSFIISSLGAGFMFGLNMYDCVCVLNTPEQVEAFTKPRFSFGAEGSIAFGPVGSGSHVETAVSKTARPMWSYMKSRGLWAGVQVDGTIVVSRSDANGVFYNERGISTQKILQGDVAWPLGAKPLFDALQAVGGNTTYNRTLSHEDIRPSPSDGSLYNATPIPAQQEPYRDEPEDRQDDKKPEVDVEEPKYESALEEKERLAKSGY